MDWNDSESKKLHFTYLIIDIRTTPFLLLVPLTLFDSLNGSSVCRSGAFLA